MVMKYGKLTAVVSIAEKRAFNLKADDIGKRSEVLRELIRAFLEDRLTIEPPKSMKLNKMYKK